MLKRVFGYLLSQGEKRTGVKLDYARKIAAQDTGLFLRYGKVFAFLDPNKQVPAAAYHVARLCGALSADCGSCVEAEINLAHTAGVEGELVSAVIAHRLDDLPSELAAVARLSSAVTHFRDDAQSREQVVEHYGESGLIELSFAMNGAALLPGVKRAMGFATACDVDLMRQIAERGKH
jgi:hypothetical protein